MTQVKEVKKALEKRLTKAKDAYADYQNNPYESKHAHALRVQIRRLRALLSFLKSRLDEEHYQTLNEGLRDSAQVYGTVRELDVLIEICTEVAKEKPELSAHFYELFRFLHKERRKEMRRTFNVTNVRLVEEMFELVEAVLPELSLTTDEDWPAFVEKRLNKKYRKLVEAYEQLDLSDYEAVHETRKTAKKVRYAAADFKHFTDKKVKPIQKHAEKMQDKLGKKTDQAVNRALLHEYANHIEENEVKELLDQLAEEL